MSPTNPADPGAVLPGTETGRLGRILERVVRDGVIFLGSGGRLDYVNGPARRLLSEDTAEIERLVATIVARIEEADGTGPHRVELTTSDGPRAVFVEPGWIEEDDCSGRILVLKDARAVEALEEDLFLANRMRGLGEIYASMAHDLKTPVHAMTLLLDTLRDSLARGAVSEEGARRLEDIDTVRDELARFHRSIQQFLSQTSPVGAARRRFDLRRLLREVARIAGPLARSREVRVRLDLGSTAATVTGFRDRLRQAFLNVVVNAVEATRSGGDVRIETRVGDRMIVTRVEDEGPGVDPDVASQVFTMHFTTKEGGSGIGLFVARAAVLAHGGEIELRNRPVQGARVEIRLPCGTTESVLG